MALHTTANEFFELLASKGPKGINAVEAARAEDDEREMPEAMESQLVTPESWGRMAWAGARVEFQRNQGKLVVRPSSRISGMLATLMTGNLLEQGGHAFPRATLGERRTLVPTISYDGPTTKRILGTCKAHQATIAQAVFSLCNLAYIRCTPGRDQRLPCMLYSALNLRPFLKQSGDWYKIAIGYYKFVYSHFHTSNKVLTSHSLSIILPTFLPSTRSAADTFWARALSTRQQTSKVVKSRFLACRSKLMALERERRAIGFEKEDERRRVEKRAEGLGDGFAGALKGLGLGFGELGMKDTIERRPVEIVKASQPPKKVVAPSVALMGVSMLGSQSSHPSTEAGSD